jgi:hypothetical protein
MYLRRTILNNINSFKNLDHFRLTKFILLIGVLSSCLGENDDNATASCIKFKTSINKLKPVVFKLNQNKENCYPCNGENNLEVHWSTASVDFVGNDNFEASLWGIYSQAKSAGIIEGNLNNFMKEYYSGYISETKRNEITSTVKKWLNDPRITKLETQQIKEALYD